MKKYQPLKLPKIPRTPGGRRVNTGETPGSKLRPDWIRQYNWGSRKVASASTKKKGRGRV